jgi:plasmid maintenance system antidote protein VapI
MSKSRPKNRARQLKPQSLGVLLWQREFWLTLIEAAQTGKLGPPDLSQLPGFQKPAVTRYAATSPGFLRGFRTYNDGKPYHAQVRPFGFMLMFQLEEQGYDGSDAPRTKRRPTMLHVVSPFHRDPAKAAKKAFDRNTGKPVSSKLLQPYCHSLRNYHSHPEAKFLNGGRADRGPTIRRHIETHFVRHIGKEANRLDSQLAQGFDPDAQSEFGISPHDRRHRLEGIRKAAQKFGPNALARAARITRQHLFRITTGDAKLTDGLLARIDQVIASLMIAETEREAEVQAAVKWLRQESQRIGLRRFAEILHVDAGYLSRVLSGTRPPSEELLRRSKRHQEVKP